MSRFLQILSWSVISAAFIGPGTVATAASAGAGFHFTLLWALLFATFACLVLQEASARITVVSGHNLGQAIRRQFPEGIISILVTLMICGAIILGCAAYEAGNILGSAAGAALKIDIRPGILTMVIAGISGILLYIGSVKTLTRFLGGIVALMGGAFLITAFLMEPSPNDLLKGLLWPAFPKNSGMLILGLIGTTVVPYNLFLGSAIARGQTTRELRFGLGVAIILGGIISMGILVVGTSVSGSFSFQGLSGALSERLGGWAGGFFALGLFAAGFSSAITAPLAAALTAKSLLNEAWRERSWQYRGVWGGVLGSGALFGVLEVQPVPVIILAQALNGILLPFVTIFLFLVINDRNIMGKSGINHAIANVGMVIVIGVTIVLGITNLTRALTAALQLPMIGASQLLTISIITTVILLFPVVRQAMKRRERRSPD